MTIRTAMARFLAAATLAAVAVCSAWAGEGPRVGEGLQAYCTTLAPPKVLYIAQSPNSEGLAERWRCVLPVDVTFAPLNYGDQECHHLCDKPLEESKEDVAYVTEQGKAWVDAWLAKLDQFGVVIAQFPPRSNNEQENQRLAEIQQKLVERVRKGGKLVFINPSWEITFHGTPLADVLPVKFDGRRKAWTAGCLGASDHPLTRGLPLEVTGTHWYGPVYAPVDDTCQPLTLNKQDQAQFWYRKLPDAGGQVVHLYQAYGGKWQWGSGTNYDTYEPERPDDTAAWDALFQRLVYGLTYGESAFPVLVKVALPDDFTCRSGDKLEVPVDVENRSAKEQTATIRVTVNHRRSQVWVASSLDVTLQARERRTVVLPVLTERIPCTDRYLIVKAQAMQSPGGADRTGLPGGPVFSESTKWVPFVHAVPVQVKPDKPACKPGERINASIVWPIELPQKDYDIAVYLNDHAGRALQVNRRLVVFESGVLNATLVMPDRGPGCASSYWITAVVSKDGNVLGTARTQVQLDKPWSMREQFQWSLWSWGGDARTMVLYKDAGFNALGCSGNTAAADRFGFWQYVEGTGINTFGVEINHDNWDAVRQWMIDTVDKQQEQGGPDSRSKSLVSLGEESGFKGGWGMRYYWDEPQAPPIPQKAFDDYLNERYAGKIDVLNAEWGTQHKSFAGIPLEKAKVRAPSQVFVTAQAWEGMQDKPQAANKFPVDTKKPDPARKYIASSAPYYETNNFFDWYYQKYCDLATQVYRERRNATPLTIMSAPGGFYPKVDVYNFAGLGPFYPKETALVGNAIARRDYGDVPGFSAAMWAYFDLRPLWNVTVMSSILAGNTHIDYWVDVPLTFNADGTHTRSSTWTKQLRRQLEPIEPILLHKQFAYTKGLGMFVPPQPVPKGVAGGHFGSAVDCNAPIYSALEESGYMPKVVRASELGEISVLIASYAQVVSAEEGRQLAEFVKNGGRLIVTPWLASCSPHGNLLSVYPSAESGLADLLGFKLLNTSQEVVREEVAYNGLPLVSKGRDSVIDPAGDVQVLAKYKDGTPVILTRAAGKGQVVYLNMIYDWDGWWNSFHEPAREAYRKLIDSLVDEAAMAPEYFIAFESAEPCTDSKGWWPMQMKTVPQPGESVPWWASQLYSDPSGKIKYLGVFSDHRSPVITASVNWSDPKARIFDLLSGAEIAAKDGTVKLTLRPGGAAFWAFVQDAPSRVSLDVPGKLEAGKPVKLEIRLRGANRDATHGVAVLALGPSGRRSDAHTVRNLSFRGDRCQIEIPTASNDEPGPYRVTAIDSITRKAATARFTLTAPKAAPPMQVLEPFTPRSSESWPAHAITDEEFIGELRKLRTIYEGTFTGLEAKYMLSYHLDVPFRPDNRHAIMRRISAITFRMHMKELIKAMEAGEHFVICSKDITRLTPLPESLQKPWPKPLFNELANDSKTLTIDGLKLIVYSAGKGYLVWVLQDVDDVAYHSSDFIAWHEKLKKALAQIKAGE
ncbi:MAG TPA: beta-galactosidase trimerization domain-containing protein [Planctomycetota bacterium]|nr:beta-galactosidase trimerization domain-containing protein [Planctomycetota bacterium]